MRELSLFTGGGGGLLGAHMLGWKTVCAVEKARDCQERLLQRQREGFLPRFPIWDDVTTFDGRPWRGCVDLVSGGFPCTDISAAGKGAGIEGSESGLWKEMARICGDVRPRYVWIENSPLLTIRGLETVLWDLAEMWFDAEWGVVSSADAGGSSLRERIWILAYDVAYARRLGGGPLRTESGAHQPRADVHDQRCREDVAHGQVVGWERNGTAGGRGNGLEDGDNAVAGSPGNGDDWTERETPLGASGDRAEVGTVKSGMGRDASRLATWMDLSAAGWRPPVAGRGPAQFPWEPPRTSGSHPDRAKRIRAIGNGQDPWALALAWEILSSRIGG